MHKTKQSRSIFSVSKSKPKLHILCQTKTHLLCKPKSFKNEIKNIATRFDTQTARLAKLACTPNTRQRSPRSAGCKHRKLHQLGCMGNNLDPLKPESLKQSVHKNKFLFLSTRSCFGRSIVSAIKSNPARTKIRASPHAAALNTPDPERGLRQLRQDSHFPTRLGTWRAGSYASMVKMCLSLHAWTLDTPCERVARPSANCVIHHTFEHLTCTILRKGSPQNPPEPTKFAFRFTFGHWTRRILR